MNINREIHLNYYLYFLFSDNNVPKIVKKNYSKALVKLYPQLQQKGLRRTYVISLRLKINLKFSFLFS